MKNMNFKTQISHWVSSETHNIEVKSYLMTPEKRVWLIYAHVFDTHPLSKKPEFLSENAPLSGGCTFDEVKTSAPIGGIKYKWQKESMVCTVGADYGHIWDMDYSDSDPMVIPPNILRDALDLHVWLIERRDLNHADNQAEQLETTTKVTV